MCTKTSVKCPVGETKLILTQHMFSWPDSNKDISYLTNLPGAPEKLEIFAADLNDPESFNGVIRGCTGVFLVAHPVSFEEKVPEEVTNQRAVKGTLGILQACLDSRTVKRVIYTSSAFTVMYNDKSSGIIDERNWTDVDYVRILKPFGESYIISKTLAERAALEFAEAHGLNLVSLIPPMIIGPFICSSCPGSIYTVLALIAGTLLSTWLFKWNSRTLCLVPLSVSCSKN